MKNKPDWEMIGGIVFIILVLAVLIVCAVLYFWVLSEYGDTPISEVPSWAIPWLMLGR